MTRSIKRNIGYAAVNEAPAIIKEETKEVFNTGLRDVPVRLRERFKALKVEGKVTGSLNSFLINTALERLNQLEKD
jgi:hypothetical protein